ncbi:FHA domain-containing protein DDL [Camellia lanceoleosa]|uniref:FHA domain-containing protein DDL n=1 Tax=Camellia lanceoleosa TaxID=1840588 RepID=A0ACC0GGV9_9ERIC|nr:FHA domain-containing protein DDL [Camellia lanceoleosa]
MAASISSPNSSHTQLVMMKSISKNGDDDSVAKMKAADDGDNVPLFGCFGCCPRILKAARVACDPLLLVEIEEMRLSTKHSVRPDMVEDFTELDEEDSGVTLLLNEPPDARKPNIRWRLYVFKAGDVLNGAKWLLVVLSTTSEDGDDDDNSVTET